MIDKLWKHFKTVHKHRKIVRQECRAVGIGYLGWKHDLSKFSPAEFISSARYFQGDKSPIEAEKRAVGYSKAWLHHKGHNPHHWEYWTDFGALGVVVANKIPFEYVLEMVCDYIAAGKVYSQEEWTQASPLAYFNKTQSERHYHPATEKCLVRLLQLINDEGLEGFHNKKNIQAIAMDYECEGHI